LVKLKKKSGNRTALWTDLKRVSLCRLRWDGCGNEQELESRVANEQVGLKR
jgi:hypothetical protein